MADLVYWEIPSTDVEASSAFFAELFGWRITPSSDGYMMFETPTGQAGGIEASATKPGRGIRVYLRVDDIPAALAKAATLGATIVQAKKAIGGDYGYWGAFEEPGGSWIGVWSRT